MMLPSTRAQYLSVHASVSASLYLVPCSITAATAAATHKIRLHRRCSGCRTPFLSTHSPAFHGACGLRARRAQQDSLEAPALPPGTAPCLMHPLSALPIQPLHRLLCASSATALSPVALLRTSSCGLSQWQRRGLVGGRGRVGSGCLWQTTASTHCHFQHLKPLL
jgi:hypothetical protein